MANNFKDNIKSNINTKNKNEELNKNTKKETDVKKEKFILKKKVDDKQSKKAIPVYMQPETVKALDKMSKKSNYSRNELINMMVEYCLENWEVE